MQQQLVTSNKVPVSVAGQVFYIPQEKAQHIISLLQQWNSVEATEATRWKQPQPWNGQTLIHG